MLSEDQLKAAVSERQKMLIPLLLKLSVELKEAFVSQSHISDFQFKPNNEVVSEFDIFINTQIDELRKQFFPEDGFLSEESSFEKSQNRFTWVVDPIDGSSNFVYSVNLFCISLSLYYNGKPLLSFIADPLKLILYMSLFENNSIINRSGEVLHLKPVYDKADHSPETNDYYLGGSIFSNYKIDLMDPIKTEYYALLEQCDYYRTMGCIAQEIVLGSLRKPFVFFSIKIRNFDVAAALHFACNMGYQFITGKKDEFLLLYPSHLESTPVFEIFLKAVQSHWDTRPLNTLEI